MTSNMIKNSLAELREKLTKMKHNKEIVTIGMKALDEQWNKNVNFVKLK